ncbi:shTK domain protein [Oesophagostomum dentatum]|uniref:ShTK domain protein n=1 Tax=Oesophagostomum dentatum TaxID=61180 RepID=A0A0B1RTN1_OESDE|nr:shTK domain protein [Oesophagostomum dentatum]
MARHCTLTCKRCDDIEEAEEYENCFDITPDCSSHADLCGNAKYKQFMTDSCAKTCKLCKPVCKDRHKNCLRFAEDGFCNDEMYTNDERQHLCGNTCGFC